MVDMPSNQTKPSQRLIFEELENFQKNMLKQLYQKRNFKDGPTNGKLVRINRDYFEEN